MKRVPSEFYALGHQMIAHEESAGVSSTDTVAAASAALLKLQARLTLYFGQEGFYRIFTRAVYLETKEHAFLAVMEVEPLRDNPVAGVRLRGLGESAAAGSAAEVREGLAAVLGRVIWLLDTLIGTDITMRELRRAWPSLSVPDQGANAEETER